MMHEIKLFLIGALAGIFLGALFDFGRAFRKNVPHKNGVVAVEDLFFWLIAGGVLFFILEQYNKGVLRFYVFLGSGIGVCLYALIFTRLLFPVFHLLMKLTTGFLRLLCILFRKCIKFVKKILILPLKNLWERIKIIHNNI